MSAPDDWQVGDLALCVKTGEWNRAGFNAPLTGLPTPGGVYTVAEIRAVLDGSVGLGFDEFVTVRSRTRVIFNPARFRRIRPLSADEHRLAIVELAADKIITAPVEV